jgi:hypothetical protein
LEALVQLLLMQIRKICGLTCHIIATKQQDHAEFKLGVVLEANTRHLERIFDQTIQYQVPLFQRPYVWTKDANLEPLWEDIQALLDKHLRSARLHPHFLGAIVLEQLANSTGAIESRQVIDGQQRFTTLQLFLIAVRDHAVIHGNEKYVERFGDMVANRRNRIDHDIESFKVWPTNSDRPAFRAVHQAGSLQGLEVAVKKSPELQSSNIVLAYRYFHQQLSGWLSGALDDAEDAMALVNKSTDERFETLWQVVKSYLQLVVIDLDDGDETQVIFETLNARGEELLPADLIKNLLFRRAAADKADVEELYESNWQRLEKPFWREDVVQGRLKRPRIDVFINHYLTLMTRDEVKASHLFNAFKDFALHAVRPEGSRIPIPTTPTEHIAQLAHYSDVFAKFGNAGEHHRLAAFLRRLEAVDTTTVFPFLLYAYAELMPDRQEAFDDILSVLESFLIRRLICGLTPKNYNRLFVELIKHVERSEAVSPLSVKEFLSRGTGDSVRFPDDREFTTAASNLPMYGRLAQYKVRPILEALDEISYHRKSEIQALPSGLEIEHVMPRSWNTHWKLSSDIQNDPLEFQRASERRDALINTIGNLTLINGTLNSAQSHSPWSIKRPELLKFSKLNLNQYFHGPDAEVWDESAIRKRTDYLVAQLRTIWPQGVVPLDSGTEGSNLRGQIQLNDAAHIKLLAATNPTALQFHSEANQPEQPLFSRGIGFSFDGEFFPAKNGVDTLRLIFEELSVKDSTFQSRFAAEPHGKSRRYLSPQRADLYERADLCEKYSIQLRSGWWMSTNHSIDTIDAIIQLACTVAGLKYGAHLVPQLRSKS